MTVSPCSQRPANCHATELHLSAAPKSIITVIKKLLLVVLLFSICYYLLFTIAVISYCYCYWWV